MAVPSLSASLQTTTPENVLYSGTDCYIMESVLGRGTFGVVIKCRRKSDSRLVAIKMIKREPPNLGAVEEEVSMLESMRQLHPDQCNLVVWYGAFEERGYACLEFECLDKSLFDFVMERQFQPLSLEVIRPIVTQVASALHHLKSLEIVHGDLKPKNIMLVDQRLQPFRVKVIDFGLAHKWSNARQGVCIQSLPYRSPEIMLALPYSTAVDVWSLGCITAFLYLGTDFYPGRTQYEMLRYIVQTQGQPPDAMLEKGRKTRRYFMKDCGSNCWRLKSLEEYFQQQACRFQDKRKTVLTSLDDFLRLRPTCPGSRAARQACRDRLGDVEMFVDVLKGMLQLDAAQRFAPCQVSEHHFITMRHFSMQTSPNSYAATSLARMMVCSQTPREAECSSSWNQPSCSAAQPVKQNPALCLDRTASVKLDSNNPHASSTSQIPMITQNQRTGRLDRASHQGERAKMEPLSCQRKSRTTQYATRSRRAGTSSPVRQSARLTLALVVKRKDERGRIPENLKRPEPNRRRLPACLVKKRKIT